MGEGGREREREREREEGGRRNREGGEGRDSEDIVSHTKRTPVYIQHTYYMYFSYSHHSQDVHICHTSMK